MASKRTWCIIAEEPEVKSGVAGRPPSSAWSLVGCAVFMGGHLSKWKRVFRRVVASSRNQGVVADSIESFLNYSECEIITVAGLAFRDIDWLISRANHEVFHRSYLIPSSSSLNYIWHLKLALSSINIITLSRRNLHSSNKAVWNPSLALVQWSLLAVP